MRARAGHAWLPSFIALSSVRAKLQPLSFSTRGEFTILQVADAHVCDAGAPCLGVPPDDARSCSSANTTSLVRRAIRAARPSLVVFTGDNICALATDPYGAMWRAFAPAIDARVPWTALLGNHDDEGGNATRVELMARISSWPGFEASERMSTWLAFAGQPLSAGTFAIRVHPRAEGAAGGGDGLILWLLDSGSASTARAGSPSLSDEQLVWVGAIAGRLAARAAGAGAARITALAFVHKPLPQFEYVSPADELFTGERDEEVSPMPGQEHFLEMLAAAGGVRAVFSGHDHLCDFCGVADGVRLCYGGSAGFTAYGRADVPRRVRVIRALADGQTISTFKLAASADDGLDVRDCEVLLSSHDASARSACSAPRPTAPTPRPDARRYERYEPELERPSEPIWGHAVKRRRRGLLRAAAEARVWQPGARSA
ncbi:hypothetical protein KFE25_008004 [Diacronema lutheri]|uniref:Calcineurin-like phosphoesterase domain-containing protein n=1 Tax=Diacronema lutheri TaxID=2081491 RepID=A0A8J6CE73_DIALT|nr:hypothetical protein KFE25_008004 [Diacronema lutheri]